MKLPRGAELYAASMLILAGLGIWGGLVFVVVTAVWRFFLMVGTASLTSPTGECFGPRKRR